MSDNDDFTPTLNTETISFKDNGNAVPESAPTDGSMALTTPEQPRELLLLPAGSKPVFPGMLFPALVPPGTIADAIRHAAKNVPGRLLGFALTKDIEEDDEKRVRREFHEIGTMARIVKFNENSEGAVQALLQGMGRFRILAIEEREGNTFARIEHLESIPAEGEETKAISLAIINTMRELIKHNPLFSEEIKMFLSRADWNDAGRLADFAVTMTSSDRDELQGVLASLNVRERLEKVLFLMRKELDINELKEKIQHQIEERISKQQREFFLREQLKSIKQELGMEKDDKTEELERYQARLAELTLPEEARKRIEEELDKIKVLSPQSPEYAVSRTYLDWLTGLPWGKYGTDQLDIAKARAILNRDHDGLEDVKKRILEFIGVAKLRGSVEGSILCLVGPPGVGKTSLGRGIAEALGRPFFRFSLGGMRDEAEIKGHRRTYIGALPGKVMQALKVVGAANPVIMLDEIDKVGASFQGDPASALLEVLDPEQNNAFRDHYLDVPFDLSKVLFIATANVPDTIPAPLLDRMEMIRLSGYIQDEKRTIAEHHLMPKLLEKNGLKKGQATFTREALRGLIDGYAREAGVRALEKAMGQCLRKIAAARAEGMISSPVRITPAKVRELLGKPRFEDDPLMNRGRAGVVMGLAWTAQGGTTLYIEAMAVPGDKGIKMTGQLGDVMTESVHIAYSLVQAQAKSFGIAPDWFKKRLIHIHVPAGATPKDGPSAGVTMATALLSLALRRRVPAKLAMTGELTLTGRVLPVGGIKEKVIAAKRSGVQKVILPKSNQKDFEEIPEKVRAGITPYYVGDFSQLFRHVFADRGGAQDE